MPKISQAIQINSSPKTQQSVKSPSKIRPASLFARTFLTSSVIFIVIIFAGWAILHNVISPITSPPVIDASYDGAHDAPRLPNPWEQGVLTGAENPDSGVSNVLPPAGFTDRKDLFYTFLILGLDKGVHTDTIMAASYDGVNKTADIIGIPRDGLVNVKRKVKKINTAYTAGTLDGGGAEGGIQQLKKELKTVIGFVPDFYVLIDIEAFEKIVQSVGGIEVDVPINMVYSDPVQDLYINIKKGPQTLDGQDALKFARYRKSDDGSSITDYQRIENQQTVIRALLSKLLRPESILKIPEFIEIFKENVKTDIKPKDMVWFAAQLKDVNGTDALRTHTIPVSGSSGLPNYYEFFDETGIVDLVNQTVNPYLKSIEAKDLDILSYEP